MAGRGPAAGERRRRRNEPERGEWRPAPGVGWQHGGIPNPPAKMLKVSRDAWDIWMRSWFAAHWTPEDLPGLEIVILLYDQVKRGEHQRANELRLQMDTYGITPKGQQDRRWKRPAPDEPAQQQAPPQSRGEGPYGHLRDVSAETA